MSKTFNENLEWFSGYICRDNEASRNLTVLNRINALKASHEEELEAAMGKFPFVEYDVAGNARHKALCDLRKWDPDKVQPFPGERDTHIKILYQILTGKAGGNVSASDAAKAVRDKLVELLESWSSTPRLKPGA